MKKEIIKSIPFKIDNIIKTNKGLTNDNYIVTINQNKYMLRYPIEDIKHLFDPNNEKQVVDTIKNENYTLPVTYYNDGIQMVPFQENLITFDQANKKTRIQEVAKLMKKLHSSKIKVEHDFDPLKQIKVYRDNIKNTNIDLSIYNEVLDQLNKHTFDPILCHNDWVEGNICFIDNKVYLIDFEYAGNNDRLFDIMSFLTENDLLNSERKQFLSLMFPSGINDKDYKTLKMYRDINNLLWYLWALMMYEFRKEKIYTKIAEIKLKQLSTEYQKDLWNKTI